MLIRMSSKNILAEEKTNTGTGSRCYKPGERVLRLGVYSESLWYIQMSFKMPTYKQFYFFNLFINRYIYMKT